MAILIVAVVPSRLSRYTYVKGNAVADIIERRCGNPFDPPR
jgi:hypothetical protein